MPPDALLADDALLGMLQPIYLLGICLHLHGSKAMGLVKIKLKHSADHTTAEWYQFDVYDYGDNEITFSQPGRLTGCTSSEAQRMDNLTLDQCR